MTTFKVDHKASPYYGHEYPEYTKFQRYSGGVLWIPLLVGPNQVRFFALSNLQEVAVHVPFMTDMLFTCAEPPPMAIYPMPALYPRDAFLGIANGILERARGQVVINLAIADSELTEAA